MRLESIRYTELENTDQKWTLEDLTLGLINLLVGKNATGKSRALKVIHSLAELLRNDRRPSSWPNFDCSYCLGFDEEGKRLDYQLEIAGSGVRRESFRVNGKELLARGDQGEGEIWAEQIDDGKMVRFQTPVNELAAVARQDAIEHPFLAPLAEWARSLRLFYFGSPLGKDLLTVFIQRDAPPPRDDDMQAAVAVFHEASKTFGEEFKNRLIGDMGELGYPLDDISLDAPVSIRLAVPIPGDHRCLVAKESDLKGRTDQHAMSQGMFRALAILIRLAHSRLSHGELCLLIDDIGEGLDFERSTRLIEVLRKWAKETGSQLIMSTNDRFVMNHVPLDEWSVLERDGGRVRALNSRNSNELFEDFRFTGLNNFSFLEMDFMSQRPVKEVALRE